MGSGSSKPDSATDSYYKPSNTAYGEEVPLTPYNLRSSIYKKKALLIGCNYIGSSYELKGCINDINTIGNMLGSWGFDVIKMSDRESGDKYPTRKNIIDNLNSAIDSINGIFDDNACLIIYYSGHGSQVADVNGDEISGKDSVIIPLDFRQQGIILDDTIRSILIKAYENRKILTIFDSCNSGSICDLRCNWFASSYKETPFLKQKIYTDPNLVPRVNFIINNKYSETSADVISISGCKDDEYSYEMVNVNNITGGALTYSLIKYIKQNTPDNSFSNILTGIKNNLSYLKFNQNPSLMSGKESFNPDSKLNDFLNI
jgi:hypothetical protein